MKDLYLENKTLKETVERGRKRIEQLYKRVKELEAERETKNKNIIKYKISIADDFYSRKKDAIKKHCIYQKHFCDGTPNPSQTRAEDVLPICPKYDICALRKNPIIPKLDKSY